MCAQVNNFNEAISDKVGQYQKMWSTARCICIQLHFPGMNKFLYIGRGAKTEGLWQGGGSPKPEMRCKDKLLEYMRKHLSGAVCHGLENPPQDRILILPYYRYQKRNLFMYFWAGRKAYFANWFNAEGSYQLFCSWKGKADCPWQNDDTPAESISSCFNEVGHKQLKKTYQSSPHITSAEVILDAEYRELFKNSKPKKREIKKRERGLQKIKVDLDKVKNWKNIQTELEEILSSGKNNKEQLINMRSGRFKLPKNLSFFQSVDYIYNKLKRYKKAIPILEANYQRYLQMGQVTQRSNYSSVDKSKIINPQWCSDKSKTKTQVKKEEDIPIKVINLDFKGKHIAIGIGLSDRGNDYLRNTWAKKNDWWFHLEDYKSAHLVWKNNDLILEPELLQLIASVLAEYSKFKDQMIPVIFTQVKNLRPVKGSPGKVRYTKEKHLLLSLLPDWKKRVV